MNFEKESSIEKIDINLVRGTLKQFQEEGLTMQVENGRVEPKFTGLSPLNQNQQENLSNYLNSLAPELSGVSAKSAKGIMDTLKNLENDPLYVKDMVHYGPSLENDYAKKRMERLSNARQKVTETQFNSVPGPERVQAIKAATFVRSHLPDMGLKTTINYLELLS